MEIFGFGLTGTINGHATGAATSASTRNGPPWSVHGLDRGALAQELVVFDPDVGRHVQQAADAKIAIKFKGIWAIFDDSIPIQMGCIWGQRLAKILLIAFGFGRLSIFPAPPNGPS